MAATLRFVDSIASGRATRLDVNDGSTFTLQRDGVDFSPPQLRRATFETLLRDGAPVPASAYSNRTLRFALLVSASTSDALGTALQNLHRELDRDRNILEFKHDGATNPVFFRTFRSPTYALDTTTINKAAKAIVDLEILCEPFAYGLRVDATAAPVAADPAAASNPNRIDVTGVLGDVPTPALVRIEAGGAVDSVWLLAARARGTPGNLTYVYQAEALTQGTDTSTQPNSASFSGAGNNYSRITFATDATFGVDRLSGVALAGAEGRGVYRVLVRAKRTSGTGTMKLQLGWGAWDESPAGGGEVQNDVVTLANDTDAHLYDLGLVSVPWGPDPVTDGYSGTELATEGILLVLLASRESGTSSLDVDYLLTIPADESLALGDVQGVTNEEYVWFDAITDTIFGTDAADGRISTSHPMPVLTGGLPELRPNVTNRLYWVADVGTVNQLGNAVSHLVTGSQTLRVSHYPRWLYIRP